ncbi:MAG: hypothetical protein HKP27_14095, partial [Myxococcales bacterium]|nr:hypothetical protein [Myxococcales bacterium]
LYRESLDGSARLGARPIEARLRLSLGRLLKRRGRRSSAREEFAASRGLAEALGMPELERNAARALGG